MHQASQSEYLFESVPVPNFARGVAQFSTFSEKIVRSPFSNSLIFDDGWGVCGEESRRC